MNTYLKRLLVLLSVVSFVSFAIANENISLKPLRCDSISLDNGMQVIIAEKHDTPAVAVYAYVKTGSIYEGRYLGCGISHYLEHLVSGGTTKNRTEQESNLLLKKIGDRANAYTTLDHTCYYITTTREHWKTAADLISDWLANCALDTNEVQREKGVIVQEIKMGEEEPGRALWKLMQKTCYMKNETRAPVIGYEDNFKSITRENIIDYYSRRYCANNMVLVIAGDVYKNEVEEVLKSTFAKIKRGKDMQWLLTPEPEVIAPRKSVRRFNVQKAKVNLSFPSIKLDDPDLFPLDLLSEILSSGESSILVKKLKNEQQLVYSISASSWTPSFVKGEFTIGYSCEESNINKAADSIISVLDELKNKPVDEKDVKRAKRKKLVSHFNKVQTVTGIARSIGGNVISVGDPNFDAKYIQGLQEVTPDDLMRVANKYFDTNKLITVALLPKINLQQQTKDKTASISSSDDSFNFITGKLNNGVRTIMHTDTDVPMVAFSICFPGGLVYETEDNNGISALLADMLIKGTETRTAEEIAEAVDQLGASLSYSARREMIVCNAQCLATDIPEMIELITDTILNSSFPTDELEKQRRISIARIVSQNDSWFQEGFINFAKVFFKGHPFAMPTLGSTNIVSKLTVKDLRYFHSKIIQPSNIVISVSGNFDIGNVSELLNKGIGGYTASTTPFSKPVVAKPEVKDKYVSVGAPRNQATVVMGFNAPSALNTNRFPFLVGESYISGSGGPLFRALRGKAALVYVVFAFPFLETEAGALIMMAQCDPKNVDLVREEMLEVANSMVMNPLTTNSVSMSINATLIPYQLNRQTVQSIAGQAAVWEYRGLGANAGKIFIDKISNVTSDQIQQYAAEYFKNWTCVVTKPESQDD